MKRRIIGHDWAPTLGPPSAWPAELKFAVSLMLNSPAPMVLLWGVDGIMLYNDAYSGFAGDRHPSLLGSKVREGWPEVAAFNDNVMRKGLAGESLIYRNQELTLTRSGAPEKAWMNLDYSPVLDEGGTPVGVLAVVIETTQSVLAERRAITERERQRRMLQQMPGFAAVVRGPDFVYEFVNDAYGAISGRSEFIGRPFKEVFPDIADQGFFELLDRVWKSADPVVTRGMELRLHGGPETQFIDFVLEPIHDETGALYGIFIGGYEVTEAYRGQALLQASESRLRLLDAVSRETAASKDADQILAITTRLVGEHLDIAVCAYADMDDDEDGFTIRGNWAAPGSQSIVGHYSLADFGELAVANLGAGQPLIINDVVQELAPDEAATFQSIGVAATLCMPLIKEGRLTALMAVHDKVPRVWTDTDLALMRDITERSWAHIQRVATLAELRASEENLRTLASAMPNQAWTAEPEGMLDWFNEQVYAYGGAKAGSLYGAGWTDMVHPDDLPEAIRRWEAALQTGEIYETEFRLRRTDGAWRWHIARAVPLRNDFNRVVQWIGTNTDIHDQKETADLLEQRVKERTDELYEAQSALRQAQKMEAVGQLTGGIAHDFNNLLMGISGSLDFIQRRLNEGRYGEIGRHIEGAQGASRRAAALTQRLLAFSRRQTLNPAPTDVNRLIEGMEEMLRRIIGTDVEMEIVGGGGLWTALVDQSQLENALLNLCINARDAMMPAGGRLTIETANEWLDEREAVARDLPPGEYLTLCVRDTGAGMTEAIAERAFDPFFTTKPLGQGTGLGLSMIYGFVRQSGGQVRIQSEVGKGSTLCLYLPRHLGAAEVEGKASLPVPVPGNGEMVLVIDDNDLVRELVVSALQEQGYNVVEAQDGTAGLQILRGLQKLDLLVTDVGLPGGMNGRQVADAARITRPGLQVLFITGYAENAVIENGYLDPSMQVITKPFATASLTRKVREMLDGR